jgi:hypothetical protein
MRKTVLQCEIITSLEKDNVVIVKDKNRKLKYILKVTKFERDEEGLDFKLESATNHYPLQEVVIRIYNVDNIKCAINFKHLFKEHVGIKYVDKITILKKQILVELKHVLEKEKIV